MSGLAEASLRMREADPSLSNAEIARRLGVTTGAVWKVLNPEKAREINRRSNRRVGRRAEGKRAADHARLDRERATCDVCGGLCGSGSALGRPTLRCRPCHASLWQTLISLVEGMWADGWTCREIADVLGWKHTTILKLRAEGACLPHRRTPEQVARIRAGRWGNAA